MPATDKQTDLLNRVLAAHEAYYDIRRDYLLREGALPPLLSFIPMVKSMCLPNEQNSGK